MKSPRSRLHSFPPLIGALLVAAALLSGCVAPPGAVSQAPYPQPSAVASSVATSAATSTAATGTTPSLEPSAALGATATASATATRAGDPDFYPDPRLTPGDVLPVTAAQVSVPGYSSTVRNVPVAEKREVYAGYRLAYPQKAGTYECDHFIPLCLGGSNSVKNLWPEPAPEFRWKDGLELYLWYEVRAGRLSLAEAQRQIRTDWYASWVKAGKPGSKVDADSAAGQAAPAPAASAAKATTMGWSVSGARYHYVTCGSFTQVKASNRRTGTIAQAKAAGKTPCKICRPPQ